MGRCYYQFYLAYSQNQLRCRAKKCYFFLQYCLKPAVNKNVSISIYGIMDRIYSSFTNFFGFSEFGCLEFIIGFSRFSAYSGTLLQRLEVLTLTSLAKKFLLIIRKPISTGNLTSSILIAYYVLRI